MNKCSSLLVFFLCSLCVLLPDHLDAQRMKNWNDKQEQGAFIEGTYSLPVSASIRLISLHESFEEVKARKGQKLYFSFEAPSSEPFLLKLQERNVVDFYMLESKPAKSTKGANQLGPWEVDAYFKKFNIPTSNLAVIVKSKDERGDHFLPVSVASKKKSSSSKKYQAVFKLSKSIRSGTMAIYKGEHRGALPADQLVQENKFGRHYGGSSIAMSIDKKNLGSEPGWYTVSILLAPKDSMKKIPYVFYFYHSP